MDIYGILAHPAHQSLSPAMHNAGFKALGIDAEFKVFDVPASELEKFMKLMREEKIKGLSVSKPHKEKVEYYLDEVDKYAQEIGAVNFIYERNNKYLGSNVDWIGIKEPIDSLGGFEGKNVVILGAGGAARAAVFTAKKSNAASITILNRTLEHAKTLANEFECEFGKLVNFKGADIIIQATSAGLNDPEGVELIPKEKLNPSMLIFEMIYSPLETRLIRDAREVGAQTITGENMLLHQGYAAFEIWTAQKPPREIMEKAVIERLG
ncbi:shikimate dehydrogenase [Patescibacteria group bacterium]